jgi:hypothetical protein
VCWWFFWTIMTWEIDADWKIITCILCVWSVMLITCERQGLPLVSHLRKDRVSNSYFQIMPTSLLIVSCLVSLEFEDVDVAYWNYLLLLMRMWILWVSVRVSLLFFIFYFIIYDWCCVVLYWLTMYILPFSRYFFRS